MRGARITISPPEDHVPGETHNIPTYQVSVWADSQCIASEEDGRHLHLPDLLDDLHHWAGPGGAGPGEGEVWESVLGCNAGPEYPGREESLTAQTLHQVWTNHGQVRIIITVRLSSN